MTKRRMTMLLCAAVLTLCMASPCALAADRSTACYYPVEVESYTAGDFDQPRIRKVYQLSLSDDPAGIPTEDFEEYGKIFNLKEAAKTLNFLVDNGLTDYDELAARVEQADDRFDDVSRRIKRLEARMAEIAQLKTHIIQYSKTREIYTAYKKSRHKKDFLAQHSSEIAQHEAAKKAFDALGGKPIPKVAQLSQEYAALLAEKQEQYAQYKALRQDMLSYRTAKQNVDKILGLALEEQEQQEEKKPAR